MSTEVATLEAEVKEYQAQLETVRHSVQADPDNAELKNLLTELEQVITLTNSAIAELKPAPAATSAKPTTTTTTTTATIQTQTQTQRKYAVNDSVLAKWKSGDRGFYPARITSITGSSSQPVYIVTFKNYDTTETLSAHELKPISSNNDASRTLTPAQPPSQKRKADTSSPALLDSSSIIPPPPSSSSSALPPPPPPSSTNTHTTSRGGPGAGVISAQAHIDTTLTDQARRNAEPSRVSDGPARPAKIPRKVKASKELEAGKSKWQAFSAKGPGHRGGSSSSSSASVGAAAGSSGSGSGGSSGGFASSGKAGKGSMFRTGDGIKARVGFTGSGQAMRKDPARSRHVYSQRLDDD